jgi:hypothetical protein
MSLLLRPFSLPASNIMAITHVTATSNTGSQQARQIAEDFGVTLTSAYEFLMKKSDLTG